MTDPLPEVPGGIDWKNELERWGYVAEQGYHRGYVAAIEDLRLLHAEGHQRLDAVREALEAHPRACDRHEENEPVACGWKRAVIDVEKALSRGVGASDATE